jgi:hypothetical protein
MGWLRTDAPCSSDTDGDTGCHGGSDNPTATMTAFRERYANNMINIALRFMD